MAEAGTGDPQAEALSSMMMPMLVLLGMMLLLSINEGIREGLADAAGTVIEPVLPYDGEFFVLTVFLVGTTMMVVNTVIRGVFMDPIMQLHLSHRSKEIRKQLMDARQSRDTARMEKMNRLQMEMTPESAKMTSMTMKPMMYTIVFVIGIFTWIGYSVEEFRVTYVSLPWRPEWGFEERFLFIFPAWVAIYIMLSAPFGRIIDRHIKIFRLARHRLVLDGAKIPEPLLHLLEDKRPAEGRARSQRSNQRSRPANRRPPSRSSKRTSGANTSLGCPSCGNTDTQKTSLGGMRCRVCLEEWR